MKKHCLIVSNTAVDLSILLKFGIELDYVTVEVLRKFKFKGS